MGLETEHGVERDTQHLGVLQGWDCLSVNVDGKVHARLICPCPEKGGQGRARYHEGPLLEPGVDLVQITI